MATIQRINIIGSREGSRNRRRLKANQTGKKFRVGIKSNISTNRNNLISGFDICIHLNAMKKTTITSINRFFFFNDTATTEIYTLSLHDALPICEKAADLITGHARTAPAAASEPGRGPAVASLAGDRKSTRLNSSHGYISYAVFCLKKKKCYFMELPPVHARPLAAVRLLTLRFSH